MSEVMRIVFLRDHLRRTVKIALVVGCVLTAINQGDVLLHHRETTLTFVKIGLNFCVPFVVSNLGLLAGRRAEQQATAAGADPAKAEARRRRESSVLWVLNTGAPDGHGTPSDEGAGARS
jgi:hypothetical protein